MSLFFFKAKFQSIGYAIVFISLAPFFVQSSRIEQLRPPNFLFILVDDLGVNDLGYAGSKYYETPNIDSLAMRGAVFTQAHSSASVCSPSRASILTGVSTPVHRITDYIGAPEGAHWRESNRFTKLLPPKYEWRISDRLATIPQVLKKNGYKTFFAGKWHLGSEKDKSLPTDKGFDINIGGNDEGGPYTGGYFSPFKNPYIQDRPEEKGISFADKLVGETIKFFTQSGAQPFFAQLSFFEVHAPVQCSEASWKKYRDKAVKNGIDETGFEMGRLLPYRKYQDNPVYAGLVAQMDAAVGKVLGALKANGLDKNTVVIFTSDNGGVTSGDAYATTALHVRGGKGQQWEGGTRVPLIIYVPWLHRAISCNIPVTGTDFFPTILSLANIKPSKTQKLEGSNLLPILKGEKFKNRPLFWHYPHYGNQGGEPCAIIKHNGWKLIHYWEDDRDEVYYLPTDPMEKHDLAQKSSGNIKKLRKMLFNWLRDRDASMPVKDEQYTQEKFDTWRSQMKTKKLQGLEKERKEIFKPDWEPNDDWWESSFSATKD